MERLVQALDELDELVTILCHLWLLHRPIWVSDASALSGGQALRARRRNLPAPVKMRRRQMPLGARMPARRVPGRAAAAHRSA